jgi:hypothetical protein
MPITSPQTLSIKIEVVPPKITYFVDPVRGRLPRQDTNYTLISQPQGIPGYAMTNIQDFYLTPAPNQFIIPLFLNLPEVFFSEFDAYFTVNEVVVRNLPLIAHLFYSQVEYWWIIALANEILDPFVLKQNRILRIPSQTVVFNKWLQRPVLRQRTSRDFILRAAI